jgi:diacylglycerol kinase (ATP)
MHTFVLARCRSVGYAVAGIAHLVRMQRNAGVHLAATVTVIAAAAMMRVSAAEWCWLVVAVGAVWVAEALNTAVELLADAVLPRPPSHPLVGRAKDVAAGGVLLAAAMAAAIGACVIGPHLFSGI